MEVFEKNLLIVGLGRIGKAVAKRAQAFDMTSWPMMALYPGKLWRSSGSKRWTTWRMGLRRADFVTLHVPLTRRPKE